MNSEKLEWFDLIFENKMTGITIVSATGKFLKVNQTYCNICGFSADELIQLDVYDITPKNEHELCRKKIKNLFEGRSESFDFEKQIITKDGTQKWVNVKGSIIPGYEDQLLAFVADIDEQKQKADQLRKNESELRLAQQVANIGSWSKDLSNDALHWSREMYRILELEEGAMPPYDEVFNLIHPDDRDLFISKMENHQEFSNLDIKHNTCKGIKTIRINARLLHENGVPTKYYGTIHDVTDTKRMELRIKDAQKIAKLGWWERDLETGEATWSDSIYEIIGIDKTHKPLTFTEYKKMVHPDDVKFIESDIFKHKNGWSNVILRYKRKDGNYAHVLSSGKVLYEGKKPVKLIGTNMDISETIEIQQKLHEAQKMARVGWYEYDLRNPAHHKISKEVSELLELPVPRPGTIDAQAYINMLSPDDREDFLYRINHARKFPEGWDNQIFRITTASGKIKYIAGSARIAFDKGDPIKIFGTLYDVTRVKRYENEIAKKDVNLKALITAMENLVFVVNDQLKIEKVFCNDTTLLSAPPENFINRTISKLWKKEPGLTLVHLVKKAFESQREGTFMYKYAPQSKELWWHAHVKPIHAENNTTRVAIVINDITARKNAEEELIKGIQKEKELSELRAQFVSMASHQFRTPVTVIKNNIELLELSGINHPMINKVQKRLHAETDRLINLMEGVMAMGKVQSGNIKMKFEPTKMSELIVRCKKHIERELANGRCAELITSGTERPVQIDAKYMEHVLNNLIENAFKYSNHSRNPEIRLHYTEDKLRISVLDFGIGIPPNETHRLFAAFQRGSNTADIPGTGLGLATAKEFVELNLGTIYYNEKQKSGTEFCIELPVEKEL